MAFRVRSALFDNKLVDIFMGVVQRLYFEKTIGSSSTNFADIMTISERVENGVKSGKIAAIVAQPAANKKWHEGFTRNKEGETSAITTSVHPQY